MVKRRPFKFQSEVHIREWWLHPYWRDIGACPVCKNFATGPEDFLKNNYCFFCKLCKRNISMKSRRPCELKKHYNRDCYLSIDQCFRKNIVLWGFEEGMHGCCTVPNWRRSANSMLSSMCLTCAISVHSTMMWFWWSPSFSQQNPLTFESRLHFSSYFSKVVAHYGRSKTIGPKLEC